MIIQHLKKSERRGSTGNGMEYLQQLVGFFKHSKNRLPSRFGQCLGGKSPKFKNRQNPVKKGFGDLLPHRGDRIRTCDPLVPNQVL